MCYGQFNYGNPCPSPFDVYGIKVSGSGETIAYAATRVCPVDVRFAVDNSNVEAEEQASRYDGAFFISLTGDYPVLGMREYRNDSGVPTKLILARNGESEAIIPELSGGQAVVYVTVIDLASSSEDTTLLLPDDLIEIQAEIDEGGIAAGTHHAEDESWLLYRSWCVGEEHFMVQTNHPLFATTGSAFIASCRYDGTGGVVGGTTGFNGTAGVVDGDYLVFMGALHDAPWVVAYRQTDAKLVTGQMLTSDITGFALLDPTEVENDLGTIADGLDNVMWYDRIRGKDYMIILTNEGEYQLWDGDAETWTVLEYSAFAGWVDSDGGIYLANANKAAKNGDWSIDSDEYVPTYGDDHWLQAAVYLDGNSRWLHAHYLVLSSLQSTSDLEAVGNSASEPPGLGGVPNNHTGFVTRLAPANGGDPAHIGHWSISLDGETLIPHRTYDSDLTAYVDSFDLFVTTGRTYSVVDDDAIATESNTYTGEFRELGNWESKRPINSDAVSANCAGSPEINAY